MALQRPLSELFKFRVKKEIRQADADQVLISRFVLCPFTLELRVLNHLLCNPEFRAPFPNQWVIERGGFF
jgi:hypothetical protein